MKKNIDDDVVLGFGDEWTRFDQELLKDPEAILIFNKYFSIFPWNILNSNSIGFDLGCGSGRWAKFVAPKVGQLYCIDPSNAIEIAKKKLSMFNNCIFQNTSVDNMNIEDNSMDFGYSLGVLHHIPDTEKGIKSCVDKLKSGAPFLIYLYYKFDNKPYWYKMIWKISEIFRIFISRLPLNIRYFLSQLIAIFIYYPFSRISKIFDKIGLDVNNFPLSSYRNYSFYTLRTDSLDRFGTRLESRFTKLEINLMMERSGLINITFNSNDPFWCAIGYKK